ncbi:hypothetical protein TA3x_000495 [Tundrisphaera sp. TA3]|uniref:hypothetical protein n=1 Tax=Tundrisphaera sp. TA3 TaxID=3435775 RepID=UPI003EBE25B2
MREQIGSLWSGDATGHILHHQCPYAAAAGLSQTISGGCARVCLRGIMNAVAVPVFHYGILKGYLAGQNAPSEIIVAADALYAAATQSTLASDALEAVRLVTEAAEKLMARVESLPAPAEQVVSIEPSREIVYPEIVPSPAIELAPEPEPAEEPLAAREELSDQAKIDAFLEARANLPADKSTKKKRQEWSQAARAAAAERMRARQAAGLMQRRGGGEPAVKPIVPEPRPVIVKNGKSSEQASEPDLPRVSLAKPTPLVESPLPHRLTIDHPGWAGKREDNQLHDSDWPDIREMLGKGSKREKIAGDYDVTVAELDVFIDRKVREVRERIAGKEAAAASGEA